MAGRLAGKAGIGILVFAGQASCLRGPVSSNVRPQSPPIDALFSRLQGETMFARRTFLLLAACLAATSCVNAPPKAQLLDYSREVTSSAAGWAMFSLTGTGDFMSMIQLDFTFRSADGTLKGGFEYSRRKFTPESPPVPIPVPSGYQVTRDNPLGGFLALKLPAGQYYIDGFSGEAPTAGFRAHLRSAPDFRVRFTVEAGRATYIGNLNSDYSRNGVRVQLFDEARRDLPLLKQRYPEQAALLEATTAR
jgi:hypothetical protein